MGFTFNPVQDGDWQGLNIILEQLSYRNVGSQTTVVANLPKSTIDIDSSGEYIDGYIDDDEEEITEPVEPVPGGETPTRKELREQRRAERKAKREAKKAERQAKKDARKRKNTELDSSKEYPDGTPDVPMTNMVSFVSSKGMDAYNINSPQENVTLPKNSIVYRTASNIAVPSSYFLDLRGIYKTTATQQYTADLAVLHDVNGNTITLTSIDETNNVGTAGPIVGGRDQAGAFSASSWIHFFFIYNPTTEDVSSLSSASPTTPTLPSGYTFFVRVGAVYFNGSSQLSFTYQMGDKVTIAVIWSKFDSHATAVDSIDISSSVPDTAKLVHGFMGLSAGTASKMMYVAAESTGNLRVGALCDAQGTGDTGYGVSGSKDFTLPLLTAQTIWWKTEGTSDIYAIGISGFTDDL
jgi:hypothetical protein